MHYTWDEEGELEKELLSLGKEYIKFYKEYNKKYSLETCTILDIETLILKIKNFADVKENELKFHDDILKGGIIRELAWFFSKHSSSETLQENMCFYDFLEYLNSIQKSSLSKIDKSSMYIMKIFKCLYDFFNEKERGEHDV